ncbi:sialomucin core protein 24-like [Bradysia coprophila]|uniref:sialomucin core protein 24-like n=1 Tax=Bradysia coprophila TaxID=38358 RepID=UPI00187D7C00|nr:sialomucin core protein 24-like [Bradysia coprophila]
MSVELNKVVIFLFVLAIGNCAPQRDISIEPSKVNQQVSYELVTPDQASEPVNPISQDTTVPPSTTSTKGPDTTTDPPKTTTKAPDTTTDPPTTTTKAPDTTTVTTPSTPTTSTTTSTTPVPTPTTPPTPTPSTSTTTPAPPTPKPEPIPCRRFDGPSFIGGIVLTVGLIAISFVVWKFYKSRTERNYHTL